VRQTQPINSALGKRSCHCHTRYNAYTNLSNPFPSGYGANDVRGVSFNWQSGPLGNFYLPATSPLIDAGSCTADQVGLYHFTTRTSQLKETTSIVDIGYHYVACNAAGQPIDTDGDGLPDYLEDTNGNGVVDPGESPWGGMPVILMQPLSQEVYWGDVVTFRVEVDGQQPLTYQWRYSDEWGNTLDLEGAVGPTLVITNVQPEHAGQYWVVVWNALGAVTSQPATLIVREDWYWDLVLLRGPRQDYVFESGRSYFPVNQVQLYGRTVIEPGAVIKCWTNSSLQVKGELACAGKSYYPVIFTSLDDDCFGILTHLPEDPPPQPYLGAPPYLDLTEAPDVILDNVRFCFANVGLKASQIGKTELWNVQFVECNTAVQSLSSGLVALHNVLFARCSNAIAGGNNQLKIEGEHVTAITTNFVYAGPPPQFVRLTNCIIVGDIPQGGWLLASHCAINPPGDVFQRSGFGYYYLPAHSPYRATGTINISPALGTMLKRKTTHPPIELSWNLRIRGELHLYPQPGIRYEGGTPDLGYHYDAIDFTVSGLDLEGGTVEVKPGTVIAVRNECKDGDWYRVGISLRNGSALICAGTLQNPIVFTESKFVQETPDLELSEFKSSSDWYYETDTVVIVSDFDPEAEGMPPYLDFRFVKFYLQQPNVHFAAGVDINSYSSSMNWNLCHCEFYGGIIGLCAPIDWGYYSYPTTRILWLNNVFSRTRIWLDPVGWFDGMFYGYVDTSFAAHNNLFKDLDFILASLNFSGDVWAFKDNVFLNVRRWQSPFAVDHDYNAYWFTEPLIPNNEDGTVDGANDLVLSGAPAYQKGPLGDYYLPANSPLYNAGSRSYAEAGLAHYTTRLDQVKEMDESSDVVNIGLHYIATPGPNSAQPKDTDADGIPDYVEDSNGNGQCDAGETDWQNPQTEQGIPDPVNTVYDDIDLDGDGMVGRIEKALSRNPLLWDNPLTLTQVVTGEEPDIATFEVPINYDALVNIGGLSLWVDGEAVSFQECNRAANGNCLLSWNTTFHWPGQHYVQARLILNGKKRRGEQPDLTVLTANGPLTPFYSANVARFNPFFSEFSAAGGAILYACLPEFEAEYSIELRTPTGELIRTITGNTSNGEIEEHWDLTWANDTPYMGDTVWAIFNVTLLGSGSSGRQIFRLLSSETVPDGKFTVACAGTYDYPRWLNIFIPVDNEAMQDCVQWGVVDPLIKPPWAGGFNENLYESDFNDFSMPPSFRGNPGFLASRADVRH